MDCAKSMPMSTLNTATTAATLQVEIRDADAMRLVDARRSHVDAMTYDVKAEGIVMLSTARQSPSASARHIASAPRAAGRCRR
jgi:hypothetical protein